MPDQKRRLLRKPSLALIAALTTTLAATGPAAAQSMGSPNGVATNVSVNGIAMVSTLGNMVFISISGTKTGNPSCSTSGAGQWSFVLPLTTTVQQQMMTVLMYARQTFEPVTLVGNGLCDTYSSVETLTNIIY